MAPVTPSDTVSDAATGEPYTTLVRTVGSASSGSATNLAASPTSTVAPARVTISACWAGLLRWLTKHRTIPARGTAE